jgi:hypothetical protein
LDTEFAVRLRRELLPWLLLLVLWLLGQKGTSMLRLAVNVSLKARFGTKLASRMAALNLMFVCL